MTARKSWRKRLAAILREWAYRLDPPSKPGPRKRRVKAEAGMPLLDSCAEGDDRLTHETKAASPSLDLAAYQQESMRQLLGKIASESALPDGQVNAASEAGL